MIQAMQTKHRLYSKNDTSDLLEIIFTLCLDVISWKLVSTKGVYMITSRHCTMSVHNHW